MSSWHSERQGLSIPAFIRVNDNHLQANDQYKSGNGYYFLYRISCFPNSCRNTYLFELLVFIFKAPTHAKQKSTSRNPKRHQPTGMRRVMKIRQGANRFSGFPEDEPPLRTNRSSQKTLTGTVNSAKRCERSHRLDTGCNGNDETFVYSCRILNTFHFSSSGRKITSASILFSEKLYHLRVSAKRQQGCRIRHKITRNRSTILSFLSQWLGITSYL